MQYIYKYETHCHTSEASACAKSSGEEMVQSYFQAGYRGLIITDHFFNGNSAIPADLDWKTRIDRFCKGYEKAVHAAEELPFDVFFGFEYGYHGTEFLTLGVDKNFLLENSDMLEWPIESFFDKVHQAGGYIIHAHPFRKREYIKEIRLFTQYIDAVEIHNSGNDFQVFNDQAAQYASRNNLIATAGSDSHDAAQLSGSGICFARPLRSIEDFIQELKKKNYTLSMPI